MLKSIEAGITGVNSCRNMQHWAFDNDALDAPEYLPQGSARYHRLYSGEHGVIFTYVNRLGAANPDLEEPNPEWVLDLEEPEPEPEPEIYTLVWGDNTGVHKAQVSSYTEAVSLAVAMQGTHDCCGGIRHPNGTVTFTWVNSRHTKLDSRDYE